MELERDVRIDLKREEDIRKVVELIEFHLRQAKLRGDSLVVDILSPKSEYKK